MALGPKMTTVGVTREKVSFQQTPVKALNKTLVSVSGPLGSLVRLTSGLIKVSKGANTCIRNRYKQVPHLTQDTNGKVTHSQLYTTNESQEVSPFPAGDHKAQINRHTQWHNKHKTEKKPIKYPQKKYLESDVHIGFSSLNITILGLKNLDVNSMHQLYNVMNELIDCIHA